MCFEPWEPNRYYNTAQVRLIDRRKPCISTPKISAFLDGFMNSSQSSSAAVGVVLCKPFGYEAICAHRSIRAFAEALADAGFPAFRFDYLGTGDSGEIDPQADQLQVWTRDALAAAQELRRRSGVTQICFLGVRLGALLATLAARQSRTESSLVLISPILSGRRYLRELRTIRMAALAGKAGADVAPNERDAGAMEVSGFTFSAATLASLKELDLTEPSISPASDLLIIDGATMPVANQWAQSLCASSARAKYLSLPGLVEMAMTAPQFAATPREMIAATRDWMTQLAARLRTESALGFSPRGEIVAARSTVLSLPAATSVPGAKAGVTERPVFLGQDGLVFGILTEPRPDEARRRAVILLNAGADHHIGASRLYVSVARRWAYRGYIVLRMDLTDWATASRDPDVLITTCFQSRHSRIFAPPSNFSARDMGFVSARWPGCVQAPITPFAQLSRACPSIEFSW